MVATIPSRPLLHSIVRLTIRHNTRVIVQCHWKHGFTSLGISKHIAEQTYNDYNNDSNCRNAMQQVNPPNDIYLPVPIPKYTTHYPMQQVNPPNVVYSPVHISKHMTPRSGATGKNTQ